MVERGDVRQLWVVSPFLADPESTSSRQTCGPDHPTPQLEPFFCSLTFFCEGGDKQEYWNSEQAFLSHGGGNKTPVAIFYSML